MTYSEGLRPEIAKSAENIAISPASLLEDNHSKEADELRRRQSANKTAAELYALDACGDARGLYPLPEKSVSLRSIAAGGSKEDKIIKNGGVKFVVVASHFDGEIFEPGKMPTGCGGLGAKDKALKDKKPAAIKGVSYYIDNNISHPDPLIQALLSANKITKDTGKPALAIAQNHRIGRIFPVGAFIPGEIPAFAVNAIDLFSKYNPESIYGKGIPELKKKDIPDVFNEFLAANEAQVRDLLLNHPNLKEMLRIQNPRMVGLSAELISAKVRYPKIASFPGILFKLHLPRVKDENGKPRVKPEILEEICNQVEYPIQHAVDNFGKPNEAFSKTDRFLIETEDITLSRDIAVRFAQEEWMKKWMALKDHQILIAQTQEGISQIIEEFRQ